MAYALILINGLAIAVAGIYFDYRIVTLIGILIIAYTFCFYINSKKAKDSNSSNDEEFVIGCLPALTVIVLIATGFLYHDKRFIAPDNNLQHLYHNCPTISDSTQVRQVIEMEGFLRGKFIDCKRCDEITQQLDKEKQLRQEARNRQEEITDLETKIETFTNSLPEMKKKLQLLKQQDSILRTQHQPSPYKNDEKVDSTYDGNTKIE